MIGTEYPNKTQILYCFDYLLPPGPVQPILAFDHDADFNHQTISSLGGLVLRIAQIT
jgi:hypothetical protein